LDTFELWCDMHSVLCYFVEHW